MTAPTPAGSAELGDLVDSATVIVCCGTGGVGKTTTSAALAIEAAHRGRRAVVVTIDPARRLADALGVPGGLGNEPVRLPLADTGENGELWAVMLDTEATFDGLVSQYASTPAQAERILANSFYRSIAGQLSGTQEYMAAERLLALHGDPRFDLVIVDTPPSRHALDFLDAPGTLARFLDHPIFRLLMLPARRGKKVFDLATQPIPVVPAAHYLCGGVATDLQGRTTIRGLYAVGEVACTGLHGANRLASNSLLEAVVLAYDGAQAAEEDIRAAHRPATMLPAWVDGSAGDPDERVVLTHNWDELRRTMWDYVGIVRSTKRLQRARTRVGTLADEVRDYYWNFRVEPRLLELRNLIQVAELIIECALQRHESRGLHFTLDYPGKLPEARHTVVRRMATRP